MLRRRRGRVLVDPARRPTKVTVADGREVFLVFNPLYRADADTVHLKSSQTLLKATWTFRF